MPNFKEIKEHLLNKTRERDGVFYYFTENSEFLRQEVIFHDAICNEEEEIHQLNSPRNRHYHEYFKKFLYRLPKESAILEIGSGGGFDLPPLLAKGYSIIACDISANSIKSIKNKFETRFKNQLIYLVANGQDLPFVDNSVDAVFMSASLHHFENQSGILAEIKRVVKKDGLIIFAMEPSKFMMRFTKLFGRFKKMRVYEERSAADEQHKGYGKNDFIRFSAEGFRLLKLKRVWLICGFLHYGSEALYRLLKLKKRLKLPSMVELALIVIDEILLKIPIVNRLNWHWICVLENKN